MKTLSAGINLAKLDKKQVRMWSRERDAVLNSNDDDKLRAFLGKYGLPQAADEQTWQAAKHKARVHCRNVFPKLRKESREWLKEHGYTEEIR